MGIKDLKLAMIKINKNSEGTENQTKYMDLSVHTSSNGKPTPDQTDQNDQNIEGKNANENISETSGILVFSISFFVALF